MNALREPFHITLHTRPPGTWTERVVLLNGRETQVLDIPPSRLDHPFPVSFEEAFSALAALPRLFIELDGSFVWISAQGDPPPWQIDGMLYDRNGQLLYVELKGNCSADPFADLLAACGSRGATLVVQLVRHAVVMDAVDFIRTRLE